LGNKEALSWKRGKKVKGCKFLINEGNLFRKQGETTHEPMKTRGLEDAQAVINLWASY
jgi:hypothetical protein